VVDVSTAKNNFYIIGSDKQIVSNRLLQSSRDVVLDILFICSCPYCLHLPPFYLWSFSLFYVTQSLLWILFIYLQWTSN